MQVQTGCGFTLIGLLVWNHSIQPIALLAFQVFSIAIELIVLVVVNYLYVYNVVCIISSIYTGFTSFPAECVKGLRKLNFGVVVVHSHGQVRR